MKLRMLVCAILLSAPAEAGIGLGEPFTLRIGDSREIDGVKLVVEFEEVVHDSRCPSTVTCVWEGVAELHVLAEAEPQPQERLLLATRTSNPEVHPTSAIYGDLVVRLLELWPYPVSPGPINPGLYLITLVVEQHTTPLDKPGWSTLKARYSR